VTYYPQGEPNAFDKNVGGKYKLGSWDQQTNIMIYQPLANANVSSLVRHIGRTDQIYEFHLADGSVQTVQCEPRR
jgi:hypothetical protein